MTSINPYTSPDIKLESNKVRIWLFFLIISAIYAIFVLLVITSANISDSVKFYTIYSYAIIAPLFTYTIWLLLYHWKAKKWPQNEEMFGERRLYLILFLLMGVCVITWAAYWNTGIFTIWMAIAIIFYLFTGNELGALIIFAIGAYAITPALVEEFNKSLPSILAFFVVLQRGKNPDQKNKGMLGNELNGFLIGLLIGLTFEGIETAGYIVSTILSGGSALDIYLQVTLRNWGPIHILGGSLGGYAAGKAERLRFELGEENLPMKLQIKKFIKRFIPIWLIPVSLHFLWNSAAVWIYLIFMAINIQNEGVFLLAIIITQLGLAVISYIFLFIFYNRAHKVAERTNRCPETGMIVAHQGVICSTLSDVIIKEEKRRAINFNYCPNCGNEKSPTNIFCKYCGVNFENLLKKSKIMKLYESYTRKLFIISIIAAILFIILSLSLFILLLLLLGDIIWALFFTQSIIELITAIIIIYAAITLRKLRKNYNGKKSIWSWLFLIYNLIGMTGALLFMCVSILINMGFLIILGETQNLILYLIFIPVLMFGALIIGIFLKKVLKKEKQVLQYQRFF